MTARNLGLYAFKRHFTSPSLHKKQPKYDTYFKSTALRVADGFIITPIHYQEPRELIKTVVKGGNYRLENRNFWIRCSSAVLYHADSFSAKELLQIANAYGRVKHHDPTLFNAIAKLFLQHEDEWKLGELPIVLNAFRACAVFHKQLFKTVLSAILKDVNAIGPQGLAFTLHSLTVTTDFSPSKATMDALIMPVFNNISQFSIENLNLIVDGMAHVRYRNASLLNLITHHVIGVRDYTRSLYSLVKALIRLDYVDAYVVDMISGFVRSNVQFMHMGAIPELLNIMLGIHKHSSLEKSVYLAVARVVTRNQDNVDCKMIFGVKAALRAIDYNDTFLDELSLRLTTLIREEYTTKDKIELLRSCKNYVLPLEDLYEAVMSSFESNCSIHNRRSVLSDSSIVSHREYMDLVLMLSELGFVKGIYQCLLALDGRRQLVKGHVAIKLYEVLLRHINYDDMCSISTTDGKIDGRVECLGDASKNKFLQDVLGGQTECTKRYATGASHETPKLLDYGFSMEDMDKTRSMCKYIQDAYRTATLMDYALGICYADSMYFMCKLIPDVVRASLETLHVEVIPAMLKRSFTLMHRECRTHENVRDLHLHLFKKLAQKDSIAELSTSSLVALLGVLPQVECNLQNQVIHLMNECFINRLTSSTTDDSTKRILCNHALELLIVGMKIDNVDSRALAKCICSQAQHIKPEHVHKLLGLLVELQFTDSSYISMLEPVVEKAITIDTDMLRIGMIDEYAGKLGLSLNNKINDEY